MPPEKRRPISRKAKISQDSQGQEVALVPSGKEDSSNPRPQTWEYGHFPTGLYEADSEIWKEICECWRRFPNKLFGNELFLLRSKFERKMVRERNDIAGDNLAKGFTAQPDPHQELIVYVPYLERLSEGIYRRACKVWETTGRENTPAFLLMIYVNLMQPILNEEEQSILRNLQSSGALFESWSTPDGKLSLWGARDDLVREIGRIKIEWHSRIQIEAKEKELEYELKDVKSKRAVPKPGRIGFAPEKLPSPDFTHSEDFRSVCIMGQGFTLTPAQAKIIELLHEAWENGNPDLGHAFILVKLESTSKRLRDLFQSNRGAWKALIISKKKGTARLNLPEQGGPTSRP